MPTELRSPELRARCSRPPISSPSARIRYCSPEWSPPPTRRRTSSTPSFSISRSALRMAAPCSRRSKPSSTSMTAWALSKAWITCSMGRVRLA